MVTALNSADINPIQFSSDWQYITIAGKNSPGAIPPNGVRGFDRETGWDKKRGKGTQGATLSLTSFPPTEGQITFQLWEPFHFVEWIAFRKLLKYTPKKTATRADALDIYYPSLADVDVTSVVTAKISPARHVGKGLYLITVDFIEWVDPPKVSVVATTNTSKADGPAPGAAPNPIIAAKQKMVAELAAKSAAIRLP